MYVPPFNAIDDEDRIRAMVATARSGWLVTVGPDGFPLATLLPILWRAERVIMHLARANQQWTTLEPDAPALLIVGGAEAYISPSWYTSKAQHGRVVPTWNYSSVHLTGTVTVHQDEAWLREAVTTLTDTREAGRRDPWRVTDAPAPYVEGQLRAIVGIEFTVTRVEGKAKFSQNRSEADRRGVISGLEAEAANLPEGAAAQAREVGQAMARDLAAAEAGPPER